MDVGLDGCGDLINDVLTPYVAYQMPFYVLVSDSGFSLIQSSYNRCACLSL